MSESSEQSALWHNEDKDSVYDRPLYSVAADVVTPGESRYECCSAQSFA